MGHLDESSKWRGPRQSAHELCTPQQRRRHHDHPVAAAVAAQCSTHDSKGTSALELPFLARHHDTRVICMYLQRTCARTLLPPCALPRQQRDSMTAQGSSCLQAAHAASWPHPCCYLRTPRHTERGTPSGRNTPTLVQGLHIQYLSGSRSAATTRAMQSAPTPPPKQTCQQRQLAATVQHTDH